MIRATVGYDPSEVVLAFGYDPAVFAVVKSIKGWRMMHKGQFAIPRREFRDFVASVGVSEVVPDASLAAEMPDDPLAGSKPSYVLPDLRPLKPTWAEQYRPEVALTADDYQATGTTFLIQNRNALLLDDMGLGKSKQAIDAVSYIAGREPVSAVLIVAKASSLGNWRNEIEQFGAESYITILRGTPAQRKALLTYRPGRVNYFVVSWPMMRIMRAELSMIDWSVVILDEAHLAKSTPMNGNQSQQAEAIHDLKSRRKIAMTGTLVINAAEDAWNVLRWLGTETRPWSQFERETLKTVKYTRGGWVELKMVVGYHAAGLAKLRQLIGTGMARRLKSEEMPALPPFIRTDVTVELSSKEQMQYRLAEEDELLRLKDDNNQDQLSRINEQAMVLRLKQITSDISVFMKDDEKYVSSKIAAAIELVESITGAGRKVIIGTQFRRVVDVLARELAEYRPAIVHGGVNNNAKPGERSDREIEVERFQTDPKCKVFIASVAACREALNLTAASAIIHIDKEWSPKYVDQFEARAQRIGSEAHSAINVYSLIATLSPTRRYPDGAPTVDAGIEKVLERKSDVAKIAERK